MPLLDNAAPAARYKMMQSALALLRELGVAAPLRQLEGYYPELLGGSRGA